MRRGRRGREQGTREMQAGKTGSPGRCRIWRGQEGRVLSLLADPLLSQVHPPSDTCHSSFLVPHLPTSSK